MSRAEQRTLYIPVTEVVEVGGIVKDMYDRHFQIKEIQSYRVMGSETKLVWVECKCEWKYGLDKTQEMFVANSL